jgi:hypothetical protein
MNQSFAGSYGRKGYPIAVMAARAQNADPSFPLYLMPGCAFGFPAADIGALQ